MGLKGPELGAVIMQVLVATRNLEDGEELLSDYRLDPARRAVHASMSARMPFFWLSWQG
jgi:hypothetical protein